MKPTVQASNINFCNIKSNAVTVTWDNGTGDRRIVVITPEKKVYTNPNTGDSDEVTNPTQFGDTGFCSTPENPDTLEQRQFFPQYRYLVDSVGNIENYRNTNCGCGDTTKKFKCDPNLTYVAPEESLPIDGETYKPNLAFGSGDELPITIRGTTSSNPSDCPSPSPSPSPSPNYELITATDNFNSSFVVYEGTGSEVTILNLDPHTGYYVSVYEFNEECLEYLTEPNSRFFITSCEVETANIKINVTDCRTCRPITSMVEITDKQGKLVDLGSTDVCGEFKSRDLETGKGYKITITAPNYDDYIINNAFVKPKAELRRSDLHPYWTQGTKIIPTYNIPDGKEQDLTYDVKL